MSGILNLELDDARYKALLSQLIGKTEQLQNDPSKDLIPKENLAVQYVLNALNPYFVVNGGVLVHEHLTYDDNQERGNLIVGYLPSPNWRAGDPAVSFIGSHFDVVPANPDDWNVPPFELTYADNEETLIGRGTSDCLGHVALLTEMFIQLAEKKPKLSRAVWAVMICSEESTTPGIGIDRLHEEGKLERCRNGPCFWIDTSERQACIGVASVSSFSLVASGLTAHSGMPNQGINAIELCDDALKYLQEKFYNDYPATDQEVEYGFQCPSSMKPTQQVATTGSVNQIPNSAQINGDIRLTPFYNIEACKAKMKLYTAQLNRDLTVLHSAARGPSQYVITDAEGHTVSGHVELTFTGETLKGIACDLTSDGYKFLTSAIEQVVGESVPYSITGSLPLVGDLQSDGYDLQLNGYAYDAYYHADNERASLEWMRQGLRIFSLILDHYVSVVQAQDNQDCPC